VQDGCVQKKEVCMSEKIMAHIDALKERHRALKEAIAGIQAMPSYTMVEQNEVQKLKLKKLHLKEEIAQLQESVKTASSTAT